MAFIFPDIAPGDIAHPDFTQLAAMPGVIGCVLKATDGVKYDTSWFLRNWPLLRAAGGSRYGETWFRGAYHFLRQAESGAAQAQAYLAAVAAAGGFGDGDMLPIVDVEGTWSPALARQIAGDFAAYVYSATGKRSILYADGDIGIGPADGFASLWTPHPSRLASWPIERMVAFQYAGDGSYYNGGSAPAKAGFPLAVPGWKMGNGKPGVDFSVVMGGAEYATDISAVRSMLLGGDDLALLKSLGWWALGATALGGAIYLGRRRARLPEARLLRK